MPYALTFQGDDEKTYHLRGQRDFFVKRGYATHVVADAVTSRRDENRRLGLSLCERAGAILTTTETVAFDLLGRAGTDAFKMVSKLVRRSRIQVFSICCSPTLTIWRGVTKWTRD